MLTGLTLALMQWQPKLILAYTWVNTCSNECYHVNHHFFPLLIMKCAKNTNSWGHCPIIFVCWLVFLAKRVIKWFWELSDTCQEVTEDHKQERAECASCRPMVVYRGRFLVPSWLIHQHTHTCIHWKARMFFHWNQGEADCQERQTARKDNTETACSSAVRHIGKHKPTPGLQNCLVKLILT